MIRALGWFLFALVFVLAAWWVGQGPLAGTF
jgi:hypothetical protein